MPRDLPSSHPPANDESDRERALHDIAHDVSPSRYELPFNNEESQNDTTPITGLLLLGAAAAFKLSVLFGGSSHAFQVGAVCLGLSLASLLASRLRSVPRAVRAGVAKGPAGPPRRGR